MEEADVQNNMSRRSLINERESIAISHYSDLNADSIRIELDSDLSIDDEAMIRGILEEATLE